MVLGHTEYFTLNKGQIRFRIWSTLKIIGNWLLLKNILREFSIQSSICDEVTSITISYVNVRCCVALFVKSSQTVDFVVSFRGKNFQATKYHELNFTPILFVYQVIYI